MTDALLHTVACLQLETFCSDSALLFPASQSLLFFGNVSDLTSQDRDYQALEPGEPIFLTAEGKELLYQGEKETFPIFINEAAYYEKGCAFICTDKVTLDVPELSVDPKLSNTKIR